MNTLAGRTVRDFTLNFKLVFFNEDNVQELESRKKIYMYGKKETRGRQNAASRAELKEGRVKPKYSGNGKKKSGGKKDIASIPVTLKSSDGDER